MNVTAGIERQISGIRAAQQLILFIWMLTFLPMKMLSRQHPHEENQISGISLRRGFSMQGDDMRRLTCCTRCLLDAAGVRLLHLYRQLTQGVAEVSGLSFQLSIHQFLFADAKTLKQQQISRKETSIKDIANIF